MRASGVQLNEIALVLKGRSDSFGTKDDLKASEDHHDSLNLGGGAIEPFKPITLSATPIVAKSLMYSFGCAGVILG